MEADDHLDLKTENNHGFTEHSDTEEVLEQQSPSACIDENPAEHSKITKKPKTTKNPKTTKRPRKSKNDLSTAEQVRKCPMCPKTYNRINELKRHFRIHSGRSYKCSVCGKGFTRSCLLKRHIRLHTGEKPYKCSECPLAFTQGSGLKIHMRNHTGEHFECNLCLKTFKESGILKRHMRTHTGEKPFKCSVCQKDFAQTAHLKTHLRVHTGERPYKCTVCPKAFCSASNLKCHFGIHTREKSNKSAASKTTPSDPNVHQQNHTDNLSEISACHELYPVRAARNRKNQNPKKLVSNPLSLVCEPDTDNLSPNTGRKDKFLAESNAAIQSQDLIVKKPSEIKTELCELDNTDLADDQVTGDWSLQTTVKVKLEHESLDSD